MHAISCYVAQNVILFLTPVSLMSVCFVPIAIRSIKETHRFTKFQNISGSTDQIVWLKTKELADDRRYILERSCQFSWKYTPYGEAI